MPFSLDAKHIVVHYHYIEDPAPENGGMNPCSISEFEKHIKFLSEHYAPDSLDGVFKKGSRNSEGRHYSVTFDDGLKDQYRNAVPILKKYGAHATFFIITQALEGILPAAHKFHVILSRISSLEAIDLWNAFVEEKYPEDTVRFFIPKNRRVVKDRRLYADVPTANIKEMFTAVPHTVRNDFLNFAFRNCGLSDAGLCDALFMDPDEVRRLAHEGFSIGIHTHTHEPIGMLGPEGLHKDFKISQKWFRKILGRNPEFFSYPYGIIPQWGSSHVEREGITHAVTVEERGIAPTDTPYLIPRYDMASLRTFLTR